MPHRPSDPHGRTFRVRRAALLFLAAATACGGDSSGVTAPPTATWRVAIGDTVIGTVSSASPNVHTFAASTGQRIALQLSVPTRNVQITIKDSVTGAVQSITVFIPGSTFEHSATPSFDGGNSVYTVTVTTDPGAAVSFQYIVHLIDTRPETAASTLTYGQPVVEPMNNGADVDDYTFTGTKGDEIIIYLQGMDSVVHGLVSLDLSKDSGAAGLASVVARDGDPDPESNTSGRYILPADGRYRVRVQSGSGTPQPFPNLYVGNYRLEVFKIDRAPEHASATVVPGDTIITEAIEHVGDIDEFQITANAGEEWVVFYQATNGLRSNALFCELLTPDYMVQISGLLSFGSDSFKLLQKGLGRYLIPISGTYTVRVRGQSDRAGLNRGPYRLFIQKVDRGPEHIATLSHVLGDTIAGESLDYPGDVDEIPFTVSTPTLFHLETWRLNGPPFYQLMFHIIRAADTSYVTGSAIDPGATLPTGGGSPTMLLDPGSYRVQVYETSSTPYAYWGGWKAILQPIDSMPEGRSMTVAGGEIVTGTIDPPGDIDTYRVPVHSGEYWQIAYQGTYNGGAGTTLEWWTDALPYWPTVTLGAIASTGLADAPKTGRLDVLADVTWRIRVVSNNSAADRGPYRFQVQPFNTAPEHHAAALVPFDTVTNEGWDFLQDVDRFTLTGTPGVSYRVTFVSAVIANRLTIRVFDPATMAELTEMNSDGYVQETVPFPMPAGGMVYIDAIDSTGYNSTPTPYRLHVFPVNTAPESVPAAIAIGDTVSGETVAYAGDVDEYTFNGTAGQTVTAGLDWYGGSPTDGNWMQIEVIDVSTGYSLAGYFDSDPTPGWGAGATATLPTTGKYILQVRRRDELHNAPPATYKMALTASP